jgi:hypothetical protein
MGRMSPRARPGSQAVTDAKPDKQENRLSVTPGAVNLVTTHPPDSRHPRHGVPELLPTPHPTRLGIRPSGASASRAQAALGDLQPSSPAHLSPKLTLWEVCEAASSWYPVLIGSRGDSETRKREGR